MAMAATDNGNLVESGHPSLQLDQYRIERVDLASSASSLLEAANNAYVDGTSLAFTVAAGVAIAILIARRYADDQDRSGR